MQHDRAGESLRGNDAHVPGSTDRVRYTFDADDVEGLFVVEGFDGTEELGRPYRFEIRLIPEQEATDPRELLGRSAQLLVERGDVHYTRFFGVVAEVTLSAHDDQHSGQTCVIEMVPALALLEHERNTRIFQEKTALEILEEVLREGLSPYTRGIDTTSLVRGRYLTRDYCVQYRETTLDFVHRLLEEEGIGYFFTHDQRETMVLFDSQRELPRAVTMDDGPVRYDSSQRGWLEAEPLVRFTPSLRLGPTTVRLRDHDWARARSRIEGASSEDEAGPSQDPKVHEVYDHGIGRSLTVHEQTGVLEGMLAAAMSAAVSPELSMLTHMVHSLEGPLLDGFTENDLSHQQAIRRELLHRDRNRLDGVSLVTGFSVGRTFNIAGHPRIAGDAEYFITKVVHTSAGAPLSPGETLDLSRVNYHNRFECLPVETPWRPTRRTRKPTIHGVQTARVTGPVGLDVHTDQHGRVRVKFHWDRSHDDPRGHDTCWLRVNQTWAGQGGPAFLFIPRVGMEVVVSFIDGDPDRPLVTGCVYNATNPTPALLPLQATKSIIRTRSVPHGFGYNELSFEDRMGNERIHLRAQRDLDELVLHDHHTKVNHSQMNAVGLDRAVMVARHQDTTVGGRCTHTVLGAYQVAAMAGHELNVEGSSISHVDGSYSLSVTGAATINVRHGELVAKAKAGVAIIQGDNERYIEMSPDGEEQGIVIHSKGPTIHVADDRIELKVGNSTITITDAAIQVNNKTFPAGGGM